MFGVKWLQAESSHTRSSRPIPMISVVTVAASRQVVGLLSSIYWLQTGFRKSRKRRRPACRKPRHCLGFLVVAGAGFEPATFGL